MHQVSYGAELGSNAARYESLQQRDKRSSSCRCRQDRPCAAVVVTAGATSTATTTITARATDTATATTTATSTITTTTTTTATATATTTTTTTTTSRTTTTDTTAVTTVGPHGPSCAGESGCQSAQQLHHPRPPPLGCRESPAGPIERPHLASTSHVLTRYRSGPLLPSNLILIGLALCCLTLSPVQPRQSHHQTCPGCPHQQQQHQHGHEAHRNGHGPGFKDSAPSPDDLRLEAIKHQILTKLGLRARPDVNRTLAAVPRHLALETLYRAEAQSTRYSDERSDHESEYPTDILYGGEKYTYRNLDQRSESSTEGNSRLGGTSYQTYGGHSAQEPEEEMDDFYARTSEIITFAEPGRTLNGQPLLEFPMSSGEPALEPLRIKRATLWARVELRHAHHYQHHRQGQTNQRNITLWVFRVRCGNTTHLRGKELGHHLELVTSLSVSLGQLGWQKFDVTRVVASWYTSNSHSKDRLTLLVDCTGCGSHVYVSTFNGHSPHVIESSVNSKGAQDPDRPFLVVRTDPAAVKRVRRRAVECNSAIKGQCCKQRFYVNFSQLGWDDWIIAPQGYYANYCRGDCAAGHRTPDTFLNYYTHVIEEYRKMDRLAGMQPCCAPLKFSPMSLIYYGPDSNIIKRDLPKMVVDECGCP